MKNIKLLLAVVILAVTFISFKGVQHHKEAEKAEITEIFEDCIIDFEAQLKASLKMDELNPKDIEVINVEEEVNLGFDTFEYLPLDFNAYAGANLSEEDFEIFENQEEVELGFDTAAYLPANFNAYAL
jgi:hypothetical protein